MKKQIKQILSMVLCLGISSSFAVDAFVNSEYQKIYKNKGGR